MKCPCNGCEDRWVDIEAKTRCHSNCKKYEDWLKSQEKKKLAIKLEGETIGAFVDHYKALHRHNRYRKPQK